MSTREPSAGPDEPRTGETGRPVGVIVGVGSVRAAGTRVASVVRNAPVDAHTRAATEPAAVAGAAARAGGRVVGGVLVSESVANGGRIGDIIGAWFSFAGGRIAAAVIGRACRIRGHGCDGRQGIRG
ncbi:hypothetical protein [Frankia canadensis]|uniref:hypothetical protein n=1 Tax=Frankia canadensis TaxID=1836972 RepID=UPI0014029FB2|nr:hypothetical protein [Frankia canadensis]